MINYAKRKGVAEKPLKWGKIHLKLKLKQHSFETSKLYQWFVLKLLVLSLSHWFVSFSRITFISFPICWVISVWETDHVMQNRTMVIRGYPPSDLISVVWFNFDGRKTKKPASFQVKLLIGQGKQTIYLLQKPVTEKLKSWLTIPYKETRKNPQNMQERI